MPAAERERIALEAVARGPRPTGRRLTDAQLQREVFGRLHPGLVALLKRTA